MVYFSNETPNFRYPTGKMNNLVYPVRGGFEDWAYSGSWENEPVITTKCEPKTYGGYSSKKTNYKKYYPNAVKAISFLLETSNDKTPNKKQLGKFKSKIKGKNRKECVLKILKNPFQKEIDQNLKNICLSNLNNGYISKNLRLLLITIDLLEPYINYEIEFITEVDGKNYLKLEWVVGGSKTVDETFVIYNFKGQNESFLDEEFENDYINIKKNYFKNFSYSNYKKYMKTSLSSGNAIWNKDKNFTVFQKKILVPSLSLNFSATILFKVDQVKKII